jgi:hypothetical protein
MSDQVIVFGTFLTCYAAFVWYAARLHLRHQRAKG